MEDAKIYIINRHIRKAAEDAAAGQLSVPAIERFLRTGEETWEEAGSGRFTLPNQPGWNLHPSGEKRNDDAV